MDVIPITGVEPWRCENCNAEVIHYPEFTETGHKLCFDCCEVLRYS